MSTFCYVSYIHILTNMLFFLHQNHARPARARTPPRGVLGHLALEVGRVLELRRAPVRVAAGARRRLRFENAFFENAFFENAFFENAFFENAFFENFAKFWRARSRLYQNEILQENMRLTAFFKIYKICILLHRCNLQLFAKKSV